MTLKNRDIEVAYIIKIGNMYLKSAGIHHKLELTVYDFHAHKFVEHEHYPVGVKGIEDSVSKVIDQIVAHGFTDIKIIRVTNIQERHEQEVKIAKTIMGNNVNHSFFEYFGDK
ncbi:hypothetical protein AB3N02_22200 [Priestia aryabhattai]|uniref:hypothetical protein n=1 Tax=Priestia aryabhattai TaxID=412384 RepID=UPI0039A1F645